MAHRRWSRLLLAQMMLPTLWACTAHPLAAPDPLPEEETARYYDVNPSRALDILFMIDDSPSMEDKQALLAANTPAFMNVLKNIPGPDGKPGLPDVHVAVISSDLGAGPTAVDQCRPGGDRGLFFGARQKPECGFTDPDARFIVSSQGGTLNNFTGDISAVFGCLARLGSRGCGQEHQLQALRVALYDGVTPENKGFLRPEAYLGIVLLTDEDDCSADPNTDLFTQNYPGFAPSWRCAREGHLCNGRAPPSGEFSTPYESCTTIPIARSWSRPSPASRRRARATSTRRTQSSRD